MKLASFVVALLLTGSVMASEIQAIVNDTPISEFDVETRAKIIMFQQKGQVGEMTNFLKQEALDELIDERIKQQEAIRQNIAITDEEINSALAHLEQQNGLEVGGFKRLLAEQNIPYQTLFDQTAANLSWIKIMQKTGRMASVTDSEIAARKNMIRDELKQERVSFAEIVVPTKEEADKIWSDLQQGADFHALVGQKSTAMSRNSDGEVVNVSPSLYGADAEKAMKALSVGQLSQPIKVPQGYAIILMLDKRAPVMGDFIQVWDMTQAILPESSRANKTMSKGIEGCEEFQKEAKDDAIKGTMKRGQVSPMQMPEDIRQLVEPAQMGAVVGPIQTRFGKLYLMKCKETKRQIVPSDDELRAQIETEKMELLSRQMVAELKRGAVIEYK